MKTAHAICVLLSCAAPVSSAALLPRQNVANALVLRGGGAAQGAPAIARKAPAYADNDIVKLLSSTIPGWGLRVLALGVIGLSFLDEELKTEIVSGAWGAWVVVEGLINLQEIYMSLKRAVSKLPIIGKA